jgi:hypothetical protein
VYLAAVTKTVGFITQAYCAEVIPAVISVPLNKMYIGVWHCLEVK